MPKNRIASLRGHLFTLPDFARTIATLTLIPDDQVFVAEDYRGAHPACGEALNERLPLEAEPPGAAG